MQNLTDLLSLLKKEAQRNGWVHVDNTASELLEQLEELNYQPPAPKYEDQPPTLLEMYGKTFPPLVPHLEASVGSLKFKFEAEHVDHVPTLFIHSRIPITKEEFDEIEDELAELSDTTASLKQVNPFMIIETHSYCVNLNEHCTLVYGVLHNVLYGEYDDPDDNDWELPDDNQ